MSGLVQVSAAEKSWNDALADEMSKGLSKTAAVKNLVRKDPEGHREYLAAYTARMNALGKTPEAEPARVTDLNAACPGASAQEILDFHKAGTPVAEAAWECAVKAQVKKGLSRKAAIRRVVAENPDLHQGYLNSYNARGRGGQTTG